MSNKPSCLQLLHVPLNVRRSTKQNLWSRIFTGRIPLQLSNQHYQAPKRTRRKQEQMGKKILMKGRIAGAEFPRGKLMWHRRVAMQSVAAIALMPLLIFCCIHRSSDSQCFLVNRTTTEIAPSLGISGPPSSTRFLGTTRVTPQMAPRSIQPFLQGLWTWPTDTYTGTHLSACK